MIHHYEKHPTQGPKQENSNFFTFYYFSYIEIEGSTNSTYPPELLNCTLAATNSSLTDLKNVMAKSPALVYITLNFTDLEFEMDTAYLNNTPNVVNPLVWALASEGKGSFLAGLTSNYLLTSLGTLGHGVHYVHLDIEMEGCDTFLLVSDKAKFEAIAKSLLLWSDLPCEEVAPNKCKIYQVCQSFFGDDHPVPTSKSDKPLTGTALFLGAYYTSLDVFYGKTFCWSISNDNLHQNELFATKFTTWIIVNVIAGLFILYGPLLLQLFTTKNKPLLSKENSEVWLANDTDLPVGLKYSLFIWKGGFNHSHFVSGIRFTVVVMVICVASHWEGIVMYFVDDMYRARQASAFRYLINYTTYWTITCIFYLMFVVCCLIGFMGFSSDENFSTSHEKEFKKSSSSAYRKLGLDGLIPVHNSVNFQLVKHMKQGVYTPFSRQSLYDNQDENRPFVLKLLVCIPRFFGYILFGSPYCQLTLYGYTIMQTSMQSNNAKIKCFYCLFSPLLGFGLMYANFEILLNAILSCAFLSIHTYAGLVLNFAHINPIIFISLSMIAYILLEINSFYDKYFQLHQMILKKAREIDETHHSRKPTQFSAIKLKLFWCVVDECQPVGFQVMLSLFILFMIGSTIAIGFWILNTVDELDALSDTVVFVYSVIIPLVIPLGRKIITSNSNQQLTQFEIESKIQRSVQKYFQDNGQPILTREPEELIPEADPPAPNSNEITQRDRGLQVDERAPTPPTRQRQPKPPNIPLRNPQMNKNRAYVHD